MFDILNGDFNPMGINFSWNNEIDYIDNSTIFNTSDGSVVNTLFNNNSFDALDIYLLPENHNVNGGLADGVGLSSALWVSGKFWEAPNESLIGTHTISHEVGHVFGLNHTNGGGGSCAELVNGSTSNCNTCGDGFCDTPADPDINFEVDVLCEWINPNGITDPMGDTYNPDETNIMARSVPRGWSQFSGEQQKYMKNFIGEAIFLQNILVDVSSGSCTCSEGDLYVTEDLTITNNRDFYGNIYISNNASLSIVGAKLSFQEGKGIYVYSEATLNLNNARLVNCPESPSWKGISVAGEVQYFGLYNFLPGMLNSSSGTVIENAKMGIDAVSHVPGLGFYIDFGGGILDVNGTSFLNCGIGVNLGRDWNSSSKIIGSYFEGGTYGVKLHNNVNTEITGNTFESVNQFDEYYNEIGAGVYSSQSKLNSTNNTFYSCDHGIFIDGKTPLIFLDALYPYFNSINCSSDNFYGNEIGIFTESISNIEAANIIGCNFFGNIGIQNKGLISFNYEGCSFYDNTMGVESISTGSSAESFIRDNSFYQNNQSNSVWFDNETKYLGNCFTNTIETDVLMHAGENAGNLTSISFDQGSEALSAGNCFSKRFSIEGLGNNVQSFFYYTKDGLGNVQNCKNPGNVLATEIPAIEERDDVCSVGSNVLSGYSPSLRLCDFPAGTTTLEKIAQLLAEIESVSNDPTLTIYQKRWLKRQLNKCLQRIIDEEVIKIINDKNISRHVRIENAVMFLESAGTFQASVMAYGLLVDKLDFIKAENILNNINSANTKEANFIDAQNVYLEYITSENEFILSSSQENTLTNAGLSSDAYAGFARTIYFEITGNRLIYNPEMHRNTTRSQKSDKIEDILLFPNPTNEGFITLDIPSEFLLKGTLSYEVYDIDGRTNSNGTISNNVSKINIADERAGVYWIKIFSNNNVISLQKIVKI